MPGATSGPFVDQIAQYWSEQGKGDGRPLGEIQGFNYGIKAVIREAYAGRLEQARKRDKDEEALLEAEIKAVVEQLSKPEPEADIRRKEFPVLLPPDGRAKGCCLEQIWYDIGFEMAKEEGYGESIRRGFEEAYAFLRAHPNGKASRIP